MRPSELALFGRKGRGWYRNAFDSVLRFCGSFEPPVAPTPGAVCDVLAITSPRVLVRRNVELTRAYFVRGTLDGCGALPGVLAALDHWERTGEIRGPKTSAFALALRGDTDAVVVDTWMARAFGYPPHNRRALRRAEFKRVERGIRSTAAYLGWPSSETQAAIWCGYQMAIGRKPAALEL